MEEEKEIKETIEAIEGEVVDNKEESHDEKGRFKKGTKVHRPLKYKTPEELQTKIDEYFNYCDETTIRRIVNKNGDLISEITRPYTITGLANYLGVERLTLTNYCNRQPFFNIIKNARIKIEACYEERALTGDSHPVFSMFTLKNNFDWKDKSEVENTDTKINKVEIEIIQPKKYEIEGPEQQDTIQGDGDNVEELEQPEEDSN